MKAYQNPEAFKQALEHRLRNQSTTGVDFGRRRQLLVFDRLLARLVEAEGDAMTLKGGLALEIRLERARTTKDVDVRMMGSSDDLLQRLQHAGQLDLGDFMSFEMQPDRRHPDIQNEGMQYDGLRFRAECRLAGKLYGTAFGLDVAFGDPVVGDTEVIPAADTLDFAGIAPPEIRLYPIESHLAEKLHAYTIPRERPNSRIKDLPDIALLASHRELDAHQLRKAIETTFAFRGTHPVPGEIGFPPESWREPYAVMAKTDELRWMTIEELTQAVTAFLGPVLSDAKGVWNPESWSWHE